VQEQRSLSNGANSQHEHVLPPRSIGNEGSRSTAIILLKVFLSEGTLKNLQIHLFIRRSVRMCRELLKTVDKTTKLRCHLGAKVGVKTIEKMIMIVVSDLGSIYGRSLKIIFDNSVG
jgi:hypothetical protein